MSSRVGFRFFQNSRAAFQSASSPFRRNATRGRRFQSTESGTADAARAQNIFQKMWSSPVGVKTVHFWAPVMKWAIVIAGISDFARPAEKLSLTQNGALMATGAIWTRWCMIIKPRNVLLAAVNFFLGCVGAVQVSRIFLYRRSLDDGSTKEALKDMVHDTTDATKHVVEKAESTVKKN